MFGRKEVKISLSLNREAKNAPDVVSIQDLESMSDSKYITAREQALQGLARVSSSHPERAKSAFDTVISNLKRGSDRHARPQKFCLMYLKCIAEEWPERVKPHNGIIFDILENPFVFSKNRSLLSLTTPTTVSHENEKTFFKLQDLALNVLGYTASKDEIPRLERYTQS